MGEKEFLDSDLSREEPMPQLPAIQKKKTIQEELEEVFSVEYPKMEEQKTTSKPIGLNVPKLNLAHIQGQADKDAKPEKDEFEMQFDSNKVDNPEFTKTGFSTKLEPLKSIDQSQRKNSFVTSTQRKE